MEYDTARRTETALYGFISFERYRLPTEHNKANRAQNKGQKQRSIIQRKIKPLEALFSFEWISYRANVYKANRTHGNEPERASTNREKRSSLYPTLPPPQMAHFARSQQSEFTPKGENSKPN